MASIWMCDRKEELATEKLCTGDHDFWTTSGWNFDGRAGMDVEDPDGKCG
jgi:hypothetical protein